MESVFNGALKSAGCSLHKNSEHPTFCNTSSLSRKRRATLHLIPPLNGKGDKPKKGAPVATYTLHFPGTDNWHDQGEKDAVHGSIPDYFDDEAGYIPVRLYHQLKNTGPSFMMPGPGAPWITYWNSMMIQTTSKVGTGMSDTVFGSSMFDIAGHALSCLVGTPTAGRYKNQLKQTLPTPEQNQFFTQVLGAHFRMQSKNDNRCWWTSYGLELLQQRLELHGINRTSTTSIKVDRVNLIGHSRGAIAAIMASHDIAEVFPNAEINIFAIDPVRGSGDLEREMYELPKNVTNYIGVYAIDEVSNFFNGVVPKFWHKGALVDPLKEVGGNRMVTRGVIQQPKVPRIRYSKKTSADGLTCGNYRLIYVPGRHGTITGLATFNGDAKPQDLARTRGEKRGAGGSVYGAIPRLIYRLAGRYFAEWGRPLPSGERKLTNAELLNTLKSNAPSYRAMRKFTYGGASGRINGSWDERGVLSARSGRDWKYLEDMIGLYPDPYLVPRLKDRTRYTMLKPLGYMEWESLESLDPVEFS
jgi:hypothetical protein